MTAYQITNRISGADLGEYDGETVEQALDAMARDAGYDDYADLLDRVPGSDRDELKIEEVA